MKDMILTLSIISLFGLILKQELEEDSAYKKGIKQGYSDGYKKARLLYECDHDKAECEILNEE